MSGYAAALAALDDDRLEALLAERPDLRAGQPPASFGELASRAATPGSLTAALARLDAGALQLAELLAVIGLPTTVEAVLAAGGPALNDVMLAERLDRLAALGLALPVADGRVVGPRSLGVPFGRPGGLGKPVAELARIGVSTEQLSRVAVNLALDAPSGRKAELVRVVAAALADPEVTGRMLAAAEDDARSLLGRARAAGGEVTVPGAGSGRYADYPDAKPATWLLDHGLLLPATYTRLVVPREAELALRGGWVFPRWPAPPSLPTPAPLPTVRDHAVAAAYRFVLAAEGCVMRLDRAPMPLIKIGTVAVRDQRTLARALDLTEPETAFLLDLLVAAGLLVVGGAWERRSLGLAPAADAWLAASRAQRWARLVAAWRDHATAFEEHLLVGYGLTPTADEPPRPLLIRQVHAAAERRRGLVAAVAEVPAGHAVPGGAIGEVLRWRQPQLWRGALDRVVLGASALLGLVVADVGVPARGAGDAASPDAGRDAAGDAAGVRYASGNGASANGALPAGGTMDDTSRGGPPEGGLRAGEVPRGGLSASGVPGDVARGVARGVARDGAGDGAGRDDGRGGTRGTRGTRVTGRDWAGPGLAAAAWAAGADEAHLACEAAGELADGGRQFLVAGDLTVVAPGGLAPDVDARLGAMADRASTGGAATWRVDAASVRRALDAGETGDSILAFVRAHSATPLPQALEYLVADVARRHGRLRVGGATTYLRGDGAAIAELVRSAAGRRLGLREVSAGVAVTGRSQQDVLAALRAAGEAPIAEDPDGTARVEARKPVRHAVRGASAPYAWPAAQPPAGAPAELVARLRATSPAPARAPGVDGEGAVYATGEVAEVCERAARQRGMVVIAYRDADVGGEVARVIAPLRVLAGAVVARTGMSHAERVFALDRIAWARPATPEVNGG